MPHLRHVPDRDGDGEQQAVAVPALVPKRGRWEHSHMRIWTSELGFVINGSPGYLPLELGLDSGPRLGNVFATLQRTCKIVTRVYTKEQ